MKKIAVPISETNQIDDHFGHCRQYVVYTVSEKNEIIDNQTIQSTRGCGCKSGISSVLSRQGVSVMLAGGIGAGAINVLNSTGIEVIRGCSGNPDEVVKNYLEGKITDNGINCAQHDAHHHHHHHHQDHKSSH